LIFIGKLYLSIDRGFMNSFSSSKTRLERGGSSALRITFIYILASTIWIVASDRLLLAIFHDPLLITKYQTIKGWVFILLSGCLVYVLARREYTGWKRSASAVSAANRALRVINACNQALVHINDEQELLDATCRLIVDEGGYRMAWVGYVDDTTQRAVQPKAWRGFEDGYLEKKRITWDDADTRRGPSGEAIRTRKPVVVRNIVLDPRFILWRDEALRRGYSSVISLPLEAENRVLGVLSIYHHRVDAFDDDEVNLLVELSQDLSYGIAAIRSHNLRQKAEHRLGESRRRFQSLVENAPLGIAISTQGVLRYVNPTFVRMFGYQDASQLVNHKVSELIVPEQRTEISERIDLRERGEQVPLSNDFTGLRQDGSRFFIRSQISLMAWEDGPASLGFFMDITPLVRSENLLKEREQRYHTLFEQSPISLWEEDFSAIVAWVRSKRQEGVGDLRAYLQENPQELFDCISKVRVLDVNQATLQLYHASTKDALLQGITKISGQGVAPYHIESVLAVAEGRSSFEDEVVNYTLDGDRLDMLLRWNVFPGSEGNFKRVIVSMLDITGRVETEANLRRQNKRLSALHSVDKAVNASLDLRVTFNVLLDQVLIELQVDAASIRLLNNLTHNLEILAMQGLREQSVVPIPLYDEQCAPARAALERQPQHYSPLEQAACGSFAEIMDQNGFVDYYATPLIAKGKVHGVLEVYQRRQSEHDQDWHSFMELLSGEAAIAIENYQLFEKLQRSNIDLTRAYDTTIEAMVNAMELREPGSMGHSQRIVDMTMRLARQMGINDAQLVAIRQGALLHDIGTLAIPDAVLFKPGPLEETEWGLIRKHPQVAFDLLAPVHYLREAGEIPFCHHEHWDGNGYPRGLKGEEIPLAARIFTVVDVWDSLQTPRPYRDAWPEERTLDHLHRQSGVQFDPEIVDQFLHLLADLPVEQS
jgi:PAS domain S-box-containing protein